MISPAQPGSDARPQADPWAQPASGSEFFITVKPLPGEGMPEMFSRLAVALKEAETAPVKLMVLGSVSAQPAAEQAMRRVFGRIDWPVTWVEGVAGDDHPIAGMQAFAIKAGRVNPITLNGQVVGSVFEEGGIRHCLLGGLGPDQSSASRLDQLPAITGKSGDGLGTGRFFAGRCRPHLVLPR